jgi:sporulation protein YlmC with PRC-barrel domain
LSAWEAAPVRLDLGTQVRCTDGVFGDVADVVVDPMTQRVTHVVVRPHHRPEDSRLVPIDLVQPGTRVAEVRLSATIREVDGLEALRESAYLRLGEFPARDPDWDVGIEETFALPYYSGADGFEGPWIAPDDHVVVHYDRVPKGDVEIERASRVTTADGEDVGHVDGFVVDDDAHITHLVLERGHVWARKQIAVPITAVTDIATGRVAVGLSRAEVDTLQSVKVHRFRR